MYSKRSKNHIVCYFKASQPTPMNKLWFIIVIIISIYNFLLELIDFSDYTNYEVADLLKLYFRELPDSLIPSKLSEALLVSYECKLE